MHRYSFLFALHNLIRFSSWTAQTKMCTRFWFVTAGRGSAMVRRFLSLFEKESLAIWGLSSTVECFYSLNVCIWGAMLPCV